MFSNGSKGISYDISWDEGETFLFRDYKEEAKSLGINVHIIAYLVNSAKYEKLKNFKSSLTKIASPDKIAIFELNGELHRHVLLGEKLDIIKKIELFDD